MTDVLFITIIISGLGRGRGCPQSLYGRLTQRTERSISCSAAATSRESVFISLINVLLSTVLSIVLAKLGVLNYKRIFSKI